MERDFEKDMMELDAAIKSNAERDNTFTLSVLQRVKQIILEQREKLGVYEDTGLTPEDINNLIELLRDRCWACENGKPYRIGSRNLTTCKHLNCAAATSNSGCTFWKLKHFDSSQN